MRSGSSVSSMPFSSSPLAGKRTRSHRPDDQLERVGHRGDSTPRLLRESTRRLNLCGSHSTPRVAPLARDSGPDVSLTQIGKWLTSSNNPAACGRDSLFRNVRLNLVATKKGRLFSGSGVVWRRV